MTDELSNEDEREDRRRNSRVNRTEAKKEKKNKKWWSAIVRLWALIGLAVQRPVILPPRSHR